MRIPRVVKLVQSFNLPAVRRFEAAGFRAWPAASVRYDGTWAIRLTPHSTAKRLNSVNPLDPDDLSDLDARLAKAERLFRAQSKPLTFRLSPLAGAGFGDHLDRLGWSRFDESIVMQADLARAPLNEAVVQLPFRDLARFVAAAAEVHGYGPEPARGLAATLAAIVPGAGLFVHEQDGRPVAVAVAVADLDLAGLFEVATLPGERGKGHGRRLLLSALRWARTRGALTGWLQVEANNEAAVHLYRSMGFEDVYRYVYRRPPEDAT
jgi:ribosomal protein S18 acetylase RimI-like enzyme